ncbi:XTP/dITP diphosphatase [Bacillus solimangrovi]|uniref:dITP/XTP pyrophosphatase n=1 Tax=Bacillus solimangrovi TaxID=1305675 RepID=A0A1E5LCZ7_9BACI|nr:XTP/dITP diphosphatase [Bacillus solimangrovi]OEH91943.1 non-canonical purine NTP pyrophosphatase [Bacillus solimangrovi]
MGKIIVATKNVGKVRDFAYLLAGKGIEVTSLLDYKDIPDVVEDGETFADNARKKAEEIAERLQIPVIADDSGLIVDALDGRPGVYSARYAGEHKSDEANLLKVLEEMNGVPSEKRTARFFCALAVAIPNKDTIIVEGTCEGMITKEQQGNQGFGYDPIFFIPSKEKTMAQLTKEEKNQISHRANALKKLKELLRNNELLVTRVERL